MNGVYFGLQHVPFESALAQPGLYPGLDTYIKEMQKYQPKYTYEEVALDGWIAADQFVTGLKAVGRNLTQKKVVAAINSETAYNGAGLTTPVNWTKNHFSAPPPYCQTDVQVVNGHFVPAFVQSNGQVFHVLRLGQHHPGAAAVRYPRPPRDLTRSVGSPIR